MNYVKRFKTDLEFRTFFASIFSSCITLIFIFYNAILGIIHHSAWNIGITVYYSLLVGIKCIVFFAEKRYHTANLTPPQKNEKQKTLLLGESIALFLIDLALIAPILLMVLQKRSIDYSEITAIAMAGYTVYKIVSASINYSKTRNNQNLSVQIISKIHFKDALVSILLLQYVLTMTFDDGTSDSIMLVCKLSSLAIWIVLIFVSFTSLKQAISLRAKKIPL